MLSAKIACLGLLLIVDFIWGFVSNVCCLTSVQLKVNQLKFACFWWVVRVLLFGGFSLKCLRHEFFSPWLCNVHQVACRASPGILVGCLGQGSVLRNPGNIFTDANNPVMQPPDVSTLFCEFLILKPLRCFVVWFVLDQCIDIYAHLANKTFPVF